MWTIPIPRIPNIFKIGARNSDLCTYSLPLCTFLDPFRPLQFQNFSANPVQLISSYHLFFFLFERQQNAKTAHGEASMCSFLAEMSLLYIVQFFPAVCDLAQEKKHRCNQPLMSGTIFDWLKKKKKNIPTYIFVALPVWSVPPPPPFAWEPSACCLLHVFRMKNIYWAPFNKCISLSTLWFWARCLW